MSGLLHHIDLTVRDPEVSAPFYETLLGFMGYRRERAFEWIWRGGSHPVAVSLVKASGDGAARGHDRYSPGLHHLAWRADSRAEVDRMHAHVRAQGGQVLDAPADYPQYNKGRGYYAVFFADPDGLKLEFVFTPVD